MQILINGQSEVSVSSQDRGFQYGDGLFETLAMENGEVRNWPLHWNRLCDGCDRLFLPSLNEIQILSEIDHVSCGVGKEIIKVIYSRGIGQRGYAFDEGTSSTRVISAHPWPKLRETNVNIGIELFVCKTRIAIQPALAGIKHLNRLENVLARHEWNSEQYAEGIMLDTRDNVIEGTMSNLFIVKNGRLQTPDISDCGVKGITRQRIIEIAKEKGISLDVVPIKMDQVFNADEVFVCNSIIGIWPVNKIRHQNFLVTPVGDILPKTNVSSITRQLIESLQYNLR